MKPGDTQQVAWFIWDAAHPKPPAVGYLLTTFRRTHRRGPNRPESRGAWKPVWKWYR